MSDIIEQMNQEIDRDEVRMLLGEIDQLTKERDEAVKSSGAWASTAGRLTGEVFDLRKERDELKAKCAALEASIDELRLALLCARGMLDNAGISPLPGEHALSTSCGQPILARVKRLEEALQTCYEVIAIYRSVIPDKEAGKAMEEAKQALETEAK